MKNSDNTKVILLFFIAFIFIGGVFIFVGVHNYRLASDGTPVNAKIDSITSDNNDDNMAIIVSYKNPVTNKIETNTLSYYSSSMRTGDILTLYYNENTGEIIHKEGSILSLIVGLIIIIVPTVVTVYYKCTIS